jgi:hypothetical protein
LEDEPAPSASFGGAPDHRFDRRVIRPSALAKGTL